MFGKPRWFRRKGIGWGLKPVCWQGWLYALIWSAVITVPYLLMILLMGHWPEAFIWMAVAICALVWDVRRIMREMEQQERKNLLYISDEDAAAHVTSRNVDGRERD